MKKKLSIIFILFVYSFVFSNEYILLENSMVTTYSNTERFLLNKNTKIDIQKVYCGSVGDKDVYFAEVFDGLYVKLEYCKNLDLKTILPDDFCAALFINGDSYLFPEYAIDMVYKQDRNYLNNFEEKNIKDMTFFDDYIGTTYWYEYSPDSQLISNIALNLGSFYGLTQFFVSKIKKVNANEYLVYSNKIIPKDKDTLGQDYIYNDLFDKEKVVFRLKKDGDYLEVYVDKEKKPRETYCYVNNDFRLEIFNLVRNNNCNIYNLTWPRHADGSCDYEDVSSVKTVSSPTTNVTPNKTMTVSENLKLRSGEATTSDVLTVMSAESEAKDLKSKFPASPKEPYLFFHPAVFIEKLEKCNLFEFNPYLLMDSIQTSYNKEIKVKSNPGFVPYNSNYTETNGYSTMISQVFNNPNSSGNYYHEGVDISVERKEGIPIKSLINGEVVYSNDQSDWTYGRFIVIKANNKYNNYNIFYLLGHLDRNKKIVGKNQLVYPGMTVGFVGNTGHCTSGDVDMNGPGFEKQRAKGMGRHLHLEVFKTKKDFETEFIFKSTNNDKKVEVARLNAPIVNPFNFDDPYTQGKQE